MQGLAQFVGVLGGVLVIYSYILIAYKKVTADNMKYHLINLIGGILLLFGLFYNPNIGSILIEVVFISVAARGVWKAPHW
jgi:hypothetical protein